MSKMSQGQVNVDLFDEVKRLQKDNETLKAEKDKYEKTVFAIANIDTVFMNNDGTERDWDYKEAFERIEAMVMPLWNEHCDRKDNN